LQVILESSDGLCFIKFEEAGAGMRVQGVGPHWKKVEGLLTKEKARLIYREALVAGYRVCTIMPTEEFFNASLRFAK
jgi:hypothetical protein